MASIPYCSTIAHLALSTKSSTSLPKFSAQFLSGKTRLGWVRESGFIGPSNGSRTKCWFKFGKNGVDAEGAGIYGSQSRDDFDRDDVEQVSLYIFIYIYVCVCVLAYLEVNCDYIFSLGFDWELDN